MDVFKIVAVGIIVSVCAIVVKQIKPELTFAVLLSGAIILLSMVFQYFSTVFGVLDNMINTTGIDSELFKIIIKIIGVGYLIEFGASLCNDTGNSSIADKMIVAGKMIILVLSLPIITSLFDIVTGLL